MLVRLFFFLFFILNFQLLFSQTFDDYKELIEKPPKEIIKKFQSYGFEIVDTTINEECVSQKLTKGESQIIFNICKDYEGELMDFVLLDADLKSMINLMNHAKRDSNLLGYTSTLNSNSSFVFFDEDHLELFFLFDHIINLHAFSFANYNRFELIKEQFETADKFNPDEDFISLLRTILSHKNQTGETLEDVLKERSLSFEFNILDMEEAFQLTKDFRKSEQYEQFKKVIDEKLLKDKTYVSNVLTTMLKLNSAMMDKGFKMVEVEEAIFKICIENELQKSLLMMYYIFEVAQGK